MQKISPNNSSIFAMLGDAYYGLGLAASSRKAYQKSLALEKDQPRIVSFISSHLPPEVADDSVASSGDVDHFAPLWRSLIIPGWGQAYNGNGSKGLAFGLTTFALLGTAYATYQAADSSYSDYANLGPGTSEGDFNTAYDKVQKMATLNHVFTVLFYAAYVYNLGDAATGARPQGSSRAELRLTPRGTPQLALNVHF